MRGRKPEVRRPKIEISRKDAKALMKRWNSNREPQSFMENNKKC